MIGHHSLLAKALIKASPAVSPTRPSVALFFIRTTKNGPVAPPDPRFRPDLGFHPFGEPMSSQAPRGALGESGGNKSAENVEENSRVPCGPELSARKADRCPHRIVFRTL
jgi:hypothetical protein